MESATTDRHIVHIGYIVEQLVTEFDSPQAVRAKFADHETMRLNDSMIFLIGKRIVDAAGDSSLDSEAFQSLRIALVAARSMLETMNRLGNEYHEAELQAMRGRPRVTETPIDQV